MIIYAVGYYDIPYKIELSRELNLISGARSVITAFPWIKEIRFDTTVIDMKDKNKYPASVFVSPYSSCVATAAPNGGWFTLAADMENLPKVYVTPQFNFLLEQFISSCSTVDMDLIEEWRKNR